MQNYKKIFLDTCVLSDIGRMSKKKRATLAYDFLVKNKYQIIISTHLLLELEKCPDNEVVKNVYDFLELSYVGFAKGPDKIFKEEIESSNINIVEFTTSMLQKDKNNVIMDFYNFKNFLLENSTFKSVIHENENIKKILQKSKRPLKNKDDYFNLIVFNHIYQNKLTNFDYNFFPSFTVWAYSLVNKIESKNFIKNYNEINDVAMSYIVPYVDIVIAEKKQINLYRELKNRNIINILNKVQLKKYSEVFENNIFVISNLFK